MPISLQEIILPDKLFILGEIHYWKAIWKDMLRDFFNLFRNVGIACHLGPKQLSALTTTL